MPEYIANVGIDLDKPRIRVEPGETLPAKFPSKEIKGLLEDGAIREASSKTDAEKSEAEK